MKFSTLQSYFYRDFKFPFDTKKGYALTLIILRQTAFGAAIAEPFLKWRGAKTETNFFVANSA